MKKLTLKFSALALMVMVALVLKLPVQASGTEAFSPVFNADFYANANADLKAAFGTDEALLFQHFITSGMVEGRQGSAEFDVRVYQMCNPDLKAVFGENLSYYYLHYINAGKAEGRVASVAATPATTPAPSVGNAPTPTPTNYVVPMAIYNDSNSTAKSPLAPKAGVSAKEFKRSDGFWTASNGYKVGMKSVVWGTPIFKEDLDYRPTNQSPAFRAYIEFCDKKTPYSNIAVEYFFLDSSSIPLVELPTTKLTRVVSTPSFEAFREKFQSLWLYQMREESRLMWGDPQFLESEVAAFSLVISPDGTKIAPADYGKLLSHVNFSLEYLKDSEEKCWKLEILHQVSMGKVPTQVMWAGIRNLLRLVEPDAELLYQQIYEHFYGGNHIFPAYDTWVPIGNSELLVEETNYSSAVGNITYYYFR